MKNETYTGLSEALQALKTRYVQLPEEIRQLQKVFSAGGDWSPYDPVSSCFPYLS